MKANSLENLLADQIFKITPADENISNYLLDCVSPFTCRETDQEVSIKVPYGIGRGYQGQIKKTTSERSGLNQILSCMETGRAKQR